MVAILPSDLSSVAGDNTTVPDGSGGTVNIAEACPPSNVNDAIRSLAAAVAAAAGWLPRGSTRPTSVQSLGLWLDTSGGDTANVLNLYDGTDDITLGTFNITSNTFTLASAAVPSTVALLASANIFTANLTIQNSDADAIADPFLILDRVSASPAANDIIGHLALSGRDSGGNATSYAAVGGQIITTTDGSEQGRLLLETTENGTLTTRVNITEGLSMTGATGGDKGSGTINATALYKNGTALITKYDSDSITGWAVGSFEEVSHGLGGVPDVATWAFRCITTEGGFATGDEISFDRHTGLGSASTVTAMANATSLRLSVQSAPERVTTKDGTDTFTMTPANWAIVLRAVKFA